jgi:hypothetical protein
MLTGSLTQDDDEDNNIYNREHLHRTKPDSYCTILHTDQARKADDRVRLVQQWHQDFCRPANMMDPKYETFLRYCTEFFIDGVCLWRKGEHKLVITQDRRLFIMSSAHNNAGHHSYFATHAHIALCYWWPFIGNNIAWYIKTCHICQSQKTQNVLIPLIIAMPAPLFAKIYVDTMHLLTSNGFKYMVQGRCSSVHWPEFDMLQVENSRLIGEWLLKCFIYRWGMLVEIVSDNGSPFIKAIKYLSKCYHINHIRISGYNSHANRLIERSHFDVRQALFKVADGDQSKWASVAYSVFWADCVTIRKCMGCSPYFAVTGTHPLLPFDISEASYLLPPPDSVLTTTDLIACCAFALQK